MSKEKETEKEGKGKKENTNNRKKVEKKSFVRQILATKKLNRQPRLRL
jgi:hypothetical protein